MSSKPLTKRELWMLTVLPALLVVIVYVLAMSWPAQGRLQQTRRQIAAARRSTVAPAELAAMQKEVFNATSLLEQEKQRGRSLREDSHTGSPRCITSLDRAEALARAARLLASGGASVVASSEANATDARRILPPFLRDAGSSREAATTQVWRLELEGTYAAIVNGLEALGQAPAGAVPVNLSMASSRLANGKRHWTLWLVI